ncbi:hypothetical protein [Caulobacter sp. CCH9-E1]|uniref:hypothetical protein n=1 Tax=Caulobacter sp. CCH9-E1 TaxID=1768768 RepID=UPI00082CAE46|nr:hypothetical protein [Caulobacter sp. CCH9-E1]
MEPMSWERASARLVNAAQAMFGEDWTREFSRFTEINLRTCQRVKAAIDAGQPDPRASSLLNEFSRRLLDVAEGLSGGPTLKVTGVRDNDLLRLRKLAADVENAGHETYGPYDQRVMELILGEAAAREEATANLLYTSAVAFGNEKATQADEEHFYYRFNEACGHLDSIYGRPYAGRALQMLIPPRRLFNDHGSLWPKLPYRRLFMIPCDDGESAALALFKTIAKHKRRPPGIDVQLFDIMFGQDFRSAEPASDYHVVIKVLDNDAIAEAHAFLCGFTEAPLAFQVDRADAIDQRNG